MKTFPGVSGVCLRVGIVINPLAGVGGPLALKGSDSLPDALRPALLAQAALATAPAQQRLRAVFAAETLPDAMQLFSVPGPMGAEVLAAAGLPCVTVDAGLAWPSGPADTQAAVTALMRAGIDLLLFAGGDGTARDVCAVVGRQLPVLGIPAGVKMHSGVFAINPQAAAALLAELAAGHWVSLDLAEVRDIDEAGLADGRVRARHYGEMSVPMAPRWLQQVKCSGREVEELVVAEIAAGLVEALEPGRLHAFGPGTTVAGVMDALGLPNTLLGFDLVRDGELLQADATAADLLAAAEREPLTVVITPTGGQGSLIGRGNQQLSPALLRRIGRDAVRVLATHAKLEALGGRPLRLDTGDSLLDAEWSGLWRVHTGYEQEALYRVQG